MPAPGRSGTSAQPFSMRSGCCNNTSAQSAYSSQWQVGVAASRWALSAGIRCESTGFHRESDMRIAPRFLCAATAWALLTSALAQNAPVLSHPLGASATKAPVASPAPEAPLAGALRNITWNNLTPKDWDPLKEFKDMKMSALSDSDPRANAMLEHIRDLWDNAPPTTHWKARPCAWPYSTQAR